jgi:hypothetical protein
LPPKRHRKKCRKNTGAFRLSALGRSAASSYCEFDFAQYHFSKVGKQPQKVELIRLTKGATLVAPSSVHWEVGNAIGKVEYLRLRRLRHCLCGESKGTDTHTGRRLNRACARLKIDVLEVGNS